MSRLTRLEETEEYWIDLLCQFPPKEDQKLPSMTNQTTRIEDPEDYRLDYEPKQRVIISAAEGGKMLMDKAMADMRSGDLVAALDTLAIIRKQLIEILENTNQ